MSTSVVRTTGKSDTGSTSHSISTGAAAGEQIIVCFTNDVATVTASTSSTGWSSLGTQAQGSSTNHRGTVFYKASADGSDTLVVNLSSAEEATWAILRIAGGIDTPQVAGSNGAAATSITLPTLTLSSTDDYLGISYVGTDSSTTTAQTCSFPAGWGNAQSQNPGVTSSAATFTAEKSFTGVSSITPGTATLGTSEQWVAFTIAVRVAPPPPGAVFDLANWKITLPTDGGDAGTDADEITQPTLDTYTDANFYTDSSSRMVCVAPAQGATTSGSSATRCELREMDGAAEADWTPFDAGVRQLTVTMRADPTSLTDRKEMVIAQIHGATGTPPIYLAAEYHVATPRIRLYKDGPGLANFLDGITTSDDFTIRLRADNGTISFYIALGTADDLPGTPNLTWDASDFTDNSGWFFKTGAYNKSTVAGGGTGEAITTISFLDLVHEPVTNLTGSDSATLTESATVTEVAVTELTGSDSATLTEGSTGLAVFTGGTFIPSEDSYFDEDAYFGGDVGLEVIQLTEQAQLSRTDHLSATDGGALVGENAQVRIVVEQSSSDDAALTEETAQVIEVTPVGPGSDSATLFENAQLTELVSVEGTDEATLTESSELTVFIESDDRATLSEARDIDRPGAIFEDQGTLDEHSQLTRFDFAPPFYFAPDQYFGENVWWGGGTGAGGGQSGDVFYFGEDVYFGADVYFGGIDLPPGVDPTGGVDPDRDGGFTASQSGAEAPADYAVLVAITTTGEVIDELAWSSWQYTDTVDWARPGSMSVTVPLLGKDRLGELIRQSLKNINSAGPAVSLVLTRRGRALFAGPVVSVGWDDDKVDIQCASIAKLMDYRVVLDPAYLLDPGNTAGNVSFELNPRDLVVKLLELGTTGDRRALPIELPTITGTSGPLVEYLASDLGTVSERIKEQVEQEGGPDVVIHPELSLDQSKLVWKVQVEEHIGATEPTAAWDYPVSVKQLTGDTDSSQMVTTGYVLGDTQTSVGSIRGFGVHSIDRGSVPPAMERADRTSVSNKRQDELNALAVSFVEANSHPAETWSISVHAEADPIIGEQWGIGDNVVITVTDHPWLDDGEYTRRITGITHDPETIQLETVEVGREVFPAVTPPTDTGAPPSTPPPPSGGNSGGSGGGVVTPPPPEPDPEPVQTRGVGGVATPAGAILTTSDSSSKLKITIGGTADNPKVYDGQGHTVGGLQVEAPYVVAQNFRIRGANGSGVYVRAAHVTVQNCDIARVRVGDSSAPNEDDINGLTFFGDFFTLQYCDIGKNDFLVDGDPQGSHTDGCQTWNNDPGESSSNVAIRFCWFDGPPISDPRYLHQGITVEGKDATTGGGGGTGDTTDWLIEGCFFRTYGNQVLELRDIQRVTIKGCTFAGSATKIVNQANGTSGVVFASDNVITGSYGSIGA